MFLLLYPALFMLIIQGDDTTAEAKLVTRDASASATDFTPKTRLISGELHSRVQMFCNVSVNDAKWITPRLKEISCNGGCSGDCQDLGSSLCGYEVEESDGSHNLIIFDALDKDFGLWSCVSQTVPTLVHSKYGIVSSSVLFEIPTNGLKIDDRIAANCSYNSSIPFKMVSSLLDDTSSSKVDVPSDFNNSTENGFLWKVTSSDYYTLNERHFGKDVLCRITFLGDYLDPKIITGSQTLQFDIPPYLNKLTDFSRSNNKAVLHITSHPFPDTSDVIVLKEGSPVKLLKSPQIQKESLQQGTITFELPDMLENWDVLIKTPSGELQTKLTFP